MDFFSFVDSAYWIMSSFEINIARPFLFILIIASLLFLIVYILEGIGLYIMAKKEGLSNTWQAWVPFANTYLIGKLAGECEFFGQKIKRAGLYAMIAEIASCIVFFSFYLSFWLIHQDLSPVLTNGNITGYVYEGSQKWLYNLYQGLYYARSVLYLVYIVFLCIILIGLFRRYYSKNPTVLAFIGVLFPLKGICIFAVRNNRPLNYKEYIRARREEYYRQQQQYNPYNQNPYNQNPYNQNPYNTNNNGQNGNGQNNNGYRPTPPPQDKGEEPFSEFSHEKEKDTEKDKKDNSNQNDIFFH